VKTLITIFIIVLCTSIFAQDEYFLALDKPGRINRIRFYTYDFISIRMFNEKLWIEGEIEMIEKDKIFINGKSYEIAQVNYLKIDRLSGMNRRFKRLAMGGVMFLGIFSINSLANNSTPFLSRGEWLAPICLVSPFLILQPFRIRKYKIGQQRVLKTIGYQPFTY
jgi:hypothetical protein